MNMHEYDKVNNEIKEFINMPETTQTVTFNQEKSHKNDKNELVGLLSELLDIYKEIQLLLETKDFENVKDKIIHSDVKNALVCESLMKILKDECTEKAEIKKLLQYEKLKTKQFDEEKFNLSNKINKLESDIEYAKRGSQELNRVLRDQKNILIAAKEKAELERKACESIKNVNKELEILRNKAYDRVSTFEKETKVLKEKVNEKDKNLKSLQTTIKQLELEKDAQNKKILNFEKIIESYKKKLETKDNSLSICNEELAKMINKDKKNIDVLEEIKEKASYYERLYKATNKQNEYLNAQLAKLINHENVEKLDKEAILVNSDLSLVTTQSKEQKYKKRSKKYKKMYKQNKLLEEKKELEIKEMSKAIEKMKLENKNLVKEKEEAVKGNSEVSKTLMNKIETLLGQNREYQNMLIDSNNKNRINEFKDDRRNEFKDDRRNEFKDDRRNEFKDDRRNEFRDTKDEDIKLYKKSEDVFNESFQTVKEGTDSLVNVNNNKFSKVESDFKYEDLYATNGATKVKGEDDSTLFLHSTKYRRSFSLANDYEDVIIEKDNIKKAPVFNFPNKLPSTLIENDRFHINKTKDLPVIEDEDVKSVDSSKSVKTTSSIKDMLMKTKNLQNKFDNLEKQLEEINESELPISKKVQDQIRAYTDYYYSDYLDFSNENDIL